MWGFSYSLIQGTSRQVPVLIDQPSQNTPKLLGGRDFDHLEGNSEEGFTTGSRITLLMSPSHPADAQNTNCIQLPSLLYKQKKRMTSGIKTNQGKGISLQYDTCKIRALKAKIRNLKMPAYVVPISRLKVCQEYGDTLPGMSGTA